MAMQYITKIFNSLAEFSKYLEITPLNDAREKLGWSENDRPSVYKTEGESTTKDYKEADNLLLYGDNKNYADFSKFYKTTTPTETTLKNTINCAVVGFAPHVPNFIAGVPTNMLQLHRVKAEKVCNIFVSMSYSWRTSAATIIKNGVEIVRNIESLEAAGTRCNVFAGYTGVVKTSLTQIISLYIKIKDAGEKIDLKKMAYPLINPSFLRRHVFRWIECYPDINCQRLGVSKILTGYDFKEAVKQITTNTNDIVLNGFELTERNINVYFNQNKKSF